MTSRPARATLAAAAVGAGLVAAWLVPLLSIAIVWPILLFVPGWVMVARAGGRIDLAGRLGLAVVISVAVSTHLVYWLSLLMDGYGREPVFAVAAMLGLAVPFAAWRGGGAGFAGIRPAIGALVVAGAAAALVGGTLAIGLWRTTPEGISSGGSNWSDFGVHLSIAQTLNAGANFPPDVPYFAGVPLVYHWFADFHAAILAEGAGIFSVPAMIVQSAVLAAALALLVFSLARRLVRGTDARRVATIAATLAVFAGGLGWIRFLGDWSAGVAGPAELIAANSYDNQWLTEWPYFRIPSVMGTGLLAHRATTVGLPMLVGAVLLLVVGLPTARRRRAGWRDRPALIGLAGLLGALLAPFHFFFFPLLPLLALAWASIGRRMLDPNAPRNAVLLLAPFLLAVPFVTAPALQAAGSGSVRLVAGWQSLPGEGGGLGVLFFYLTNLGVPFALAIVALVASRVPMRAFLAAWLIGLFLIPNLVELSIINFDMNKYFQAMWVAVAILAAWLIRRWPAQLVAAVLILSIPSPMLVAGWTATSHLQVLSTNEVAAARWAAEATPPDAVFVTDGSVNAFTDAAGRRRLTTFGPYIANLGYDPDVRIADVTQIYCGGDAERAAALMQLYGATYVVDAARPADCFFPTDFGIGPFTIAYENGGLRVWRLAD